MRNRRDPLVALASRSQFLRFSILSLALSFKRCIQEGFENLTSGRSAIRQTAVSHSKINFCIHTGSAIWVECWEGITKNTMKRSSRYIVFVILASSPLYDISGSQPQGIKYSNAWNDSLQKRAPSKEKGTRDLERRRDSIYHARSLLPLYLQKIDDGQLRKIKELENANIPATDSTRRLIHVQIWLRGLDKPALDSILAAKAKIGLYICDTRKGCDEAVLKFFKTLGVKVDQYPGVGELYAQVPFDSVASVAKVSKVFQITGMPHMRTVEGR